MIGFILAEQSYRYYLFGSASFSIKKMRSIHPLGEVGELFTRASKYPEIVYELKPNIDTWFKLAGFQTNSRGLRDKEYTLSKSDDTFRAVVVGDSYTMPAGVEIDDSFHSLLEEKFNQERTDLNYEFINFGVGGYSLRQYWGVIRFKAHEYDPDLIVVGFCQRNDHKVSPNKIYGEQYKVKPRSISFFHSFIAKRLKQGFSQNPAKKRMATIPSTFSEDQSRYMSDIFSEMSTYGSQKSIPIVIVLLDYLYNEKYANELQKLVEDNGLYFVNASLPFRGKNVDQYMIYPTDGHPNDSANRIFAEQLHNYFEKSDFLVR